MDFFRNLTGASAPDEPPASVLAEWNKYNGGDIESQTAVAATQAPSGRTFLTTVQESVSGAAGAFSGPQSSTTTQTCAVLCMQLGNSESGLDGSAAVSPATGNLKSTHPFDSPI